MKPNKIIRRPNIQRRNLFTPIQKLVLFVGISVLLGLGCALLWIIGDNNGSPDTSNVVDVQKKKKIISRRSNITDMDVRKYISQRNEGDNKLAALPVGDIKSKILDDFLGGSSREPAPHELTISPENIQDITIGKRDVCPPGSEALSFPLHDKNGNKLGHLVWGSGAPHYMRGKFEFGLYRPIIRDKRTIGFVLNVRGTPGAREFFSLSGKRSNFYGMHDSGFIHRQEDGFWEYGMPVTDYYGEIDQENLIHGSHGKLLAKIDGREGLALRQSPYCYRKSPKGKDEYSGNEDYYERVPIKTFLSFSSKEAQMDFREHLRLSGFIRGLWKVRR